MLSPKPFPALRYSPARVDLAAVLGPATSDPRHVRRLLDTSEPGHASRAALFVAEWRRAGVLLRDTQPSLTVVRRRSSDGDEALGAFAAVSVADLSLAGIEPAEDALRAQLFDVARVVVEPALVAVVDDSGRMRRTLEGAADREPDATVALGADTFEAFVVDDETTAARLAALPFTSQRILSGADALAAQAAWWTAKARGVEDAEGRAGAYGLAFFVEEKDGWTRAPIGLVLAPLFGGIDAAS